MTQAKLRLRVYSLWVGFWMISTLAMLVAPVLRRDGRVGAEQLMGVVTAVAGIWVPPLTCLAAFWFPENERRRASTRSLSQERVIGSLSLTACYLGFVLILIVHAIYMIRYDSIPAGPNAIAGESLEERINEVVKLALLASPLALAPINWLTGGVETKD